MIHVQNPHGHTTQIIDALIRQNHKVLGRKSVFPIFQHHSDLIYSVAPGM